MSKADLEGEISELMTLTNGQGGVFRDSVSLHQLLRKLSATQDLARWPNIPARRILINQSEQNSVLMFQIYPDVQCIVQKKMFLFSFANCLHLLWMMKSRTLAVVYLWCSLKVPRVNSELIFGCREQLHSQNISMCQNKQN